MSANEKGFVLVNEKYLHWLMKSICVGKWTCRENICRVYGQSTRRLISVLANEPLIVGTPHTCPLTVVLSCCTQLCCDCAFSHHYQGSIDFNTVIILRTIGMYFLVFTGNIVDIG